MDRFLPFSRHGRDRSCSAWHHRPPSETDPGPHRVRRTERLVSSCHATSPGHLGSPEPAPRPPWSNSTAARAWRVDGATSMVAWLVQRCGVTAATAREWVTAAAKLTSLPKISDALSQGKLSFDQVKPLVEVAKPETDATLAEQATHWSAKQVRELAIAARNQSDERSTGFYARRFLRFDDRRRTLTGVLPEDQYAVVKSSLVARASRRLRDRTPFDQRMADALVSVCKGDATAEGSTGRRGREDGPRRGPAPQPAHGRRPRRHELPGRGRGRRRARRLGPVSREVARRLACDAKVLVSADGPDGQSLNLGRTRRDPELTAQRMEIRRRDKGCRFPGCTHTEFTDVHHVVHWVDGGPTDLDNLVELCDQHHRCVHEMGWKISGDANVELTFRSPTGRLLDLDALPDLHCSARRTAWLIASCSATFCARPGTLTRTSAGAGAARPEPARAATARSPRGPASPNPRATAPMSLVGGVPKSCSNVAGFEGCRLRQEREDSSSAVVEHDERARDLRQVDQSRDVVEEGQVTEERDRVGSPFPGPPPRRRDAQRGRHDAVDPVRASVRQHPRRYRVGGGEPLEIPDRHGGRHHEGCTGRRGVSVDGTGHEWLAEIGPEHARRWPPAPSPRAARQESSHCGSHGEAPVATASSSQGSGCGLVELGRHPLADRPTAATGRRRRSAHRPAAASETYVTERPGEPGGPEQHDGSGSGGLRADDGVGSGDGPLHPAPRQRVRQDGPAEPIGQRAHTSGVRRSRRMAAGDDDPAAPERFQLRAGGPVRSVGDRAPSDPGGGGSVVGDPVSGSRNSRLRCTGPGPWLPWSASSKARTARVSRCAPGPRPGRPGERPTGRRGEQPVLFDGLRRAGVMQLGRPVRRAHDERDPGVVRLDHGRVQLGGGSAARHADDGGPPGRHRQPQGEERRAALVEADVDPKSLRQGSASGVDREPAQIDRIGDPEPDPLVHQGGAEGGLYAHPSCHSMSKCAARGRRWSSCTASPRRVGSGAASATIWPSRTRSSRSTFPDTPAPDSVRADLPTTAALVAEAVRAIVGDETVRPARLFAGRPGGPPGRHGYRSGLAACGPHRRDRRHGGCGGAGTSSPGRRGHRRGARDLGRRRRFLEGWLRGPLFGRSVLRGGRPHRTPPQQRVGPRIEPAVVRDRHPGPAVGSPPDSALSGPGHGGNGRHPLCRARLCGSPVRRRRRLRPSYRGAAMPCIWPSPNRPGRIVRHWLDMAGLESGGPHRSRPTVRSAPAMICRRAVAPSMGSSARPLRSPRANRTGSTAKGIASNARSDHAR